MSSDVTAYWNAQASTFDEEPDHGLRERSVRDTWAALLADLLGATPVTVVDLGCGTGSLSVLLAEQGHRVTGVDVAAAMVDRARRKADERGVAVDFAVADASAPPLEPGAFDVVLARHVVWALPDPRASLRLWTDLLATGGRMVLVEGRWDTGAGLPADALRGLLDPRLDIRQLLHLGDPELWGRQVTDERYALVAALSG